MTYRTSLPLHPTENGKPKKDKYKKLVKKALKMHDKGKIKKRDRAFTRAEKIKNKL